MKISVVIPCYNAANELPNAVASILKQGFDGTEIIVVDDQSSDNTVAVAERLKQSIEHLIVVQEAANGGVAKARNTGLRQAKGEYVCFLDADDAYGDGLFAGAIAVFEERPWIDAVDFPIFFVNCHREITPNQRRAMEASSGCNIIVRRSLVQAFGGFPEDAAFRTQHAGEDVAFRSALRRWGSAYRLEGFFLEYAVRRGSHFDLFMDASEGKHNPNHSPDLAARAREAVKRYVRGASDRMKSQAKIANTALLQCRSGNVKFDFEVFNSKTARQRAVETLTGKTYPAIEFLGDVKCVLDIGSNIGASVIFFATKYPNARIVGLEPALQPFILLKRNVVNDPNVRVFNIGLHSATAKRPIFVAESHSMTNSILPNALSGKSQEEVQLVAADLFTKRLKLDRPDIIKIDTEGCEIPIINAMIVSFRNAKAIYLEYYSEEDRLQIDRILCDTHVLFYGKIAHPHRGELVYVRNDAFPSPSMRDRWKIAGVSLTFGEPAAGPI